MVESNKKNIYILAFVIWVVLFWGFILQDLFHKKYLKHYKILLSRDPSGKRFYVYGDELLEYLNFCKANLPEEATYSIVGLESCSIDERRAIYYLYPHLRSNTADYLLVFGSPGYKQDGYTVFKSLDKRRFILEKNPNE